MIQAFILIEYARDKDHCIVVNINLLLKMLDFWSFDDKKIFQII